MADSHGIRAIADKSLLWIGQFISMETIFVCNLDLQTDYIGGSKIDKSRCRLKL